MDNKDLNSKHEAALSKSSIFDLSIWLELVEAPYLTYAKGLGKRSRLVALCQSLRFDLSMK
jgi:hypothetical protein